jgi:hypothetical protein
MYYMNNMIVVDNIYGLFIYLDFRYLGDTMTLLSSTSWTS